MTRHEEIDRQTLMRRYAAGERDFSDLVIRDSLSEDFLQEVDLSNINLSKSGIAASFNGATLRRSNLHKTVWCQVQTKDIDFTGADMTGFNMQSGGVFVRCNFTNVICDETTDIWQTTFYGCINDNFSSKGASLAEVRFLSISHRRE